jgi:hypothetical protein
VLALVKRLPQVPEISVQTGRKLAGDKGRMDSNGRKDSSRVFDVDDVLWQSCRSTFPVLSFGLESKNKSDLLRG